MYFLHKQLCHLQRQLYFFTPNLDTFITRSHLTALARIFRTVLESSGEKGHLCRLLDLSGKPVSFSPQKYAVNVGFFVDWSVSSWRFPSIPSLLWVFITNEYWLLSNKLDQKNLSNFFCICWNNHVIFSSWTNWFSNAEAALHTWDKSHLVVVCKLLVQYWMHFANILFNTFTFTLEILAYSTVLLLFSFWSVFVWFGYYGNTVLEEWIRKYCLYLHHLEETEETTYHFFQRLVECSSGHIWAQFCF